MARYSFDRSVPFLSILSFPNHGWLNDSPKHKALFCVSFHPRVLSSLLSSFHPHGQGFAGQWF